MNNADSNEQFDADNVQGKADVLRARDVIPGSPKRDEGRLGTPVPYGNIARQEPVSQEPVKNMPIPPAEVKRSLGTEQQKSEIPKFNLADEIMAEHRRITAIRRKAPGEKGEAQKPEREDESAGNIIRQPSPALSEQEQIISEIVARDIERLCRSSSSSLRK